MASHKLYEPTPRFAHISECAGNKAVVQGGVTNDSSEKQSNSVVEIFNSELWKQTQVVGDGPSPVTYLAASASLHDDLFTFGGKDCSGFLNSVHRLDTKTWCWNRVSPQNADGAPMPKYGCGMIALGNSLGVFGGYGIPPHPSASFIKNTKHTDGRGWTNEFHIYNLQEGSYNILLEEVDTPTLLT